MSTRGILAVEQDGAWKGFYIRSDAYPAWAGAELFTALKANGFAGTCAKVEGARLFEGMRERATPTTHANRGDLEWIYFLKPATKTVHVYAQGAFGASLALPGLRGTWAEMSVHTVTNEGRIDPPELKVEFPVPWPHFPVAEGWKEATTEQAYVRLDTRKRIARDCDAAGLTVNGFLELVGHAICEAIFQAEWKGTRSDGPLTRVYVPFRWSTGSVNWRVRLGSLEVLYPPPGPRGNIVHTDSTGAERIGVWAPGGAEAAVEIRRSQVTRALGPNAKAAYDILMSAVPSVDWVLAFFDQVRALQVPDGEADAAGAVVFEAASREQGLLPWQVFHHPDGRIWAIRAAKNGYQLRLGDPKDDPVIKERPSRTTDVEILRLVGEQLADGFVRQADEPP